MNVSAILDMVKTSCGAAMSDHVSVCVFCGSRDGTDPAYAQAAHATGAMLAANGWQLVYGAGDVGLMGRVAQAAQDGGGRTFGVIPGHLRDLEVGRAGLDTFVVTETMHERKKVMFMNAAAIVVLPGGAGSLDEFFEVLTWRQLSLHTKPIYLLNVDGFWEPLIALLSHVVARGFAAPDILGIARIVPDVGTLQVALREDLG